QYGHQNILDISDIHDNRHEDVCKRVGGCRMPAQFIVHYVKLRFDRVFVTKHLDDLLSVDHLFDVAVYFSKGFLLADKIGRAFPADLFHYKEQDDHHEYNKDRQDTARIDHCGEDEN